MSDDDVEQLFLDLGSEFEQVRPETEKIPPEDNSLNNRAENGTSENTAAEIPENNGFSAADDSEQGSDWTQCDPDDPEDLAAKAWLEQQSPAVPFSFSENDGLKYSAEREEEEVEEDDSAETPEDDDAEPDFDSVETEPDTDTDKEDGEKRIVMSPSLLRRAALAFLASQKPSCAALRVPVCGIRIKADAVAFWLPPKVRSRLNPVKCAVVLTFLECPDFSEKPRRYLDCLESISQLERQKAVLEDYIRLNEPQTKIFSLFQEEEKWDFSLSENPDYKKCVNRIAALKERLPSYILFSRLLQDQVADEYYIAAPAGVIDASLIPEGWGFLEIGGDLTSRLTIPAPVHDIPEENRRLLAWRTAERTMQNVMFSNGVEIGGNENIPDCRLRTLPRRRKFLL